MLIIFFIFTESVELSDFSLGENTPFVKFIRVFELLGSRKAASWMSVSQPPPGLPQFAKYQVILEVDMGLYCDDFKMIFQTRFGGKRWVTFVNFCSLPKSDNKTGVCLLKSVTSVNREVLILCNNQTFDSCQFSENLI